jgi:hypothetical protein
VLARRGGVVALDPVLVGATGPAIGTVFGHAHTEMLRRGRLTCELLRLLARREHSLFTHIRTTRVTATGPPLIRSVVTVYR